MSFKVISLVLLSGGAACSLAQADDLSDVRAIRSLTAEGSQVIRLAAQHRLTAAYTRAMKQEARDQLVAELQAAKSNRVKMLAGEAIDALDKNDAGALGQIALRLFAMEGPHERAD